MVTLPARAVDNNNNNNNGRVVANAATEMIDGHEYAVFNIYRDTLVCDIMDFEFKNGNPYIKIVLQEDWRNCDGDESDGSDQSTTIDMKRCQSLIIDLNGHTWDQRAQDIELYQCYYLLVRDSSAAGTGKMVNAGFVEINYDENNYPAVSFILESGTLDFVTGGNIKILSGCDSDDALQAHIYGGKITGGQGIIFDFYYNSDINSVLFHMEGGSVPAVIVDQRCLNRNGFQMQLSPYISGDLTKINSPTYRNSIIVARDLHFAPFENLSYDYYAVSTSDSFCGAYNYAYGYAWEKTADEMADLAVAADKTYYVWARTKDQWYHCLEDLRYLNGKLVMV